MVATSDDAGPLDRRTDNSERILQSLDDENDPDDGGASVAPE